MILDITLIILTIRCLLLESCMVYQKYIYSDGKQKLQLVKLHLY